MDPNTGEIFGPMPTGDADPGELLTERKLRDLLRDKREELMNERQGPTLSELERAAEHVGDGGRLVAVDAAAAQRARLGDRELRRRKRRGRR